MIRAIVVALAAVLTAAPPLAAQMPDSLLAAGVRAYRNLEFDAAAGFLVRAADLFAAVPDTARQAEALTYLGATEVYRGHADSARAVFRRTIRLAPAFRIDRLIFPPEVTAVFDGARRATPAVAARLAPLQRFRVGDGGITGTLLGSTFHQIVVEVQRPDATAIQRLYAGPIADSLEIAWDGRASDGEPVGTGRYQLSVASLDSAGLAARLLRIPLEVTSTRQDTLPFPAPIDGQLLPERRAVRGALEALVGGLLVGVGAAALPSAVAPDASLAGGRFVVGGLGVVAGAVGFFAARGDRPIPENVAANDSLRTAWQTERERVAAENERRRGTADVIVRTGRPQVMEREGS